MSDFNNTFIKTLMAVILAVVIMTNLVPVLANNYSNKLIKDAGEELSEEVPSDEETKASEGETDESDGEIEEPSEDESDKETEEASENESDEEMEEPSDNESDEETEESSEDESDEGPKESSGEETAGEEKDGKEETNPSLEALPILALDDSHIIYPDTSVAVVFTHSGLEEALQNVEISSIHLGADIKLEKAIQVLNNGSRSDELILDGINPYAEDYDENKPAIHTLTERSVKTDVSTANMYVGTNGNLAVITLRNMVIKGYNYYGTFQFSSDAFTKGKTLIYENITYYGSQPIYISYGDCILIDSDFILNDAGQPGEVAEAANVELAGEVNIVKQRRDDINSLFWIREKDGGIFIREDARVTIKNESSGTRGLYYMEHNDSYFIIGDNSYLSYQGYGKISGKGTWLNEFTIGTGAEVTIEMLGDLSGHTTDGPIYTRVFTVEEDAKVMITALENKASGQRVLIHAPKLYIRNPEYMAVLNRMPYVGVMNGIMADYAEIETDEIRHWRETLKMNGKTDIFSGSAADTSDALNWYNEDGSSFSLEATAADKKFYSYQGAEKAADKSLYRFIGTNGFAFNRLNGITYENGDADAGEPPVDVNSPYRSAAPVTILGNEGGLEKNYQKFAYWQEKGSGEIYEPGDTVILDRDIILIPVFEKARLQVSFDGMAAGLENPPPIEVIWGETYGEALHEEIERDGYYFAGWHDESGNLITRDSRVEINENHTLYARWQTQVIIRHVNQQEELILNESEVLWVPEGDSIMINPAAIDGYQEQYYRISGEENAYPLTDPFYPARSVSVHIYYASTMIAVKYPKGVHFYAYLNENGTVTSKVYEVVNYSELPIKVSFHKLTSQEENMDGIQLVSEAKGRDELHLNLIVDNAAISNGFTQGVANIVPGNEYNTPLGTLGGSFVGNQLNKTGSFKIGGYYAGRFYAKARRPRVDFTFHYELSE